MTHPKQFSYRSVRNSRGEMGLRPLLPINLHFENQTYEYLGLLDTGADVNVLPYEVGQSLGLAWENQQTVIQLSGNLAQSEARGVILEASVDDFPPIKLAFAWSRLERIPLLLGQVNFFLEFDVCFFRSRGLFEIAIKSG